MKLRPVLWVLGFVVVVWAALALTAPAGTSTPARPRQPATVAVTCPPSAPNAASGCLVEPR